MAIEIDPNNHEFDMAEFVFKEQKAYANSLEMGSTKDGGDEKTVTNSDKPVRYGRVLKKRTWSASDILPEFYDLFMDYYESGELIPIKVFNFGTDGEQNPVGTLVNASVDEVTWKSDDDGVGFDASGKALDFIRSKR